MARTASLCRREDPESLADAIAGLLDDTSLLQRLGVNGRARAQQMTWQHTVDQLIALYAGILDGRASLRAASEQINPNA